MTPKQREILKLLVDGWGIGISTGIDPRAWVGKGGEVKRVHFSTFHSLRSKGLIERNIEHAFENPQHYHITIKGKVALECAK